MLANYSDKLTHVKPNCYMIVDAGGGTVDIVVHQVDGESIQSIMPPIGNSHGGTAVNERFSKLLQKLTDDPDFKTFLTNCRGGIMKSRVNKATLSHMLFAFFEDAKVRFGEKFCIDEKEKRSVHISLDSRFVKHYKEKNLRAAVSNMHNPNINYACGDDVLTLSYSFVHEELFKPVVDEIVQCVIDTIHSTPAAIETIYLVGGFGSSNYVCQMIRQALAEPFKGHVQKIDLVVPHNYTLAVSHGAVMYHQKPELITIRIPDANYGVSVSTAFKHGVHDEHYLFHDEDDGSERCNHVFSLFIEKGKAVHYNTVYVNTCVPSSKKLKMVVLQFCSSFNMVQYTQNKQGQSNVNVIGKVTVAVPPCGLPRNKRIIEISMYLGGTEIQAIGKYLPTGEEVQVVLDFLSSD